MTMRKCMRTLNLAKAMTLELLCDNERSTKEISKFLSKEIGEEWKQVQTLNLLNLFNEVFIINGFTEEGAVWGVTQEVWQKVVCE